MKQSPLILNNYQLLEITIIPEDGYVSNGLDDYPDIANTEFTSNIAVGTAEDEEDSRDYLLSLKLKIKPREKNVFPYFIEVAIQGHVTVVHDLPIEKFDRENFAVVNGSALLYGALRDTILALTGRFIYGEVMLPTVNFLDLKKTHPVKRKKTRMIKKKSVHKKSGKKKT